MISRYSSHQRLVLAFAAALALVALADPVLAQAPTDLEGAFQTIADRFAALLTWVRNILIIAVVAAAVWNLGTWLKGRPNIPGLVTVIVTGVMLGGVQLIISYVLTTNNVAGYNNATPTILMH